MASVGKAFIGFTILIICIAGAFMIMAQQSTTPLGQFNIGNTSDVLNTSSQINQTAGLVVNTTSFGMTIGGIAIFLALIVIFIMIVYSFMGRR
jgi:hypothetical protein